MTSPAAFEARFPSSALARCLVGRSPAVTRTPTLTCDNQRSRETLQSGGAIHGRLRSKVSEGKNVRNDREVVHPEVSRWSAVKV